MSVLVETSVGNIIIDLYTSYAPHTCNNFLKLCASKQYNDALFYTVEENFITQIRPVRNTLQSIYTQVGLPSAFPEELPGGNKSQLKHTQRGIVSMICNQSANTPSGTIGSMFYITLTDTHLDYLDDKHVIIGYIAEGCDVLIAKLNSIVVDSETHQPLQNIRIRHTIVLHDPLPAIPNTESLITSSGTASPTPIYDENDMEVIAYEQQLKQLQQQGKSAEELQREKEEREAQQHAAVLNILGDLPSVDMKPPDNVLFVAKLNPITSDDDLELIFSRFGKIRSCHIVRDPETKQSLQYAFIEFATKDSCEEAYLKMNNVIIDDRRIVVDFSQSVSRLWNKYNRQKYGHRHQHQHKKQKISPNNTDAARAANAIHRSSRHDDGDHDGRSHYRHRSRSRSRSRSYDDSERHRRRRHKHKHRHRRDTSESPSPSRSRSPAKSHSRSHRKHDQHRKRSRSRSRSRSGDRKVK